MENYYGDSEAIGYSRSDRQHGRLVGNRAALPRTKSQFSILNNEHLTSKDVPDLPSSSYGSHDPFCANGNQNRGSSASKSNGTVCRAGSSGSRRRAASSVAVSRRPGSLRKETLRRKSRRSSVASANSLARQGCSTGRQSSGGATSIHTSSPMTRTSSAFPSSPPCNIRPRTRNSYKRSVSFKHSRRSSTASGPINSTVSNVPRQPDVPKIMVAQHGQNPVANHDPIQSSPPPIQVSKVVRRKEAALPGNQIARPRHARNSSQYIKHEARKVSNELERACEEAFNRSSVASSVQTAATERANVYDTPPSSISYRESHPGNDGASRKISGRINPDTYVDRPLPAIPDETPRTFVARELEETRRRLAERYREEDLNNTAGYQDLLLQLNTLLMPTTAKAGEVENHHVALVSDADGIDVPPSLPVISEDHKLSLRPGTNNPQVSCSGTCAENENKKPRYLSYEQQTIQDTIRLINPSRPPSPVLPLNVRKASSITTQNQPNSAIISKQGDVPRQAVDVLGTNSLYSHGLRPVAPIPLDDNYAVRDINQKLETKEPMKRRGWMIWKQKREEGIDRKGKTQHISYTEQEENGQGRECPGSPRRAVKLQKRLSEIPPAQSDSTGTEFPMRNRTVSGEKKGLLKFFAKLGEHKSGTNKQESKFHDRSWGPSYAAMLVDAINANDVLQQLLSSRIAAVLGLLH